MSQTETLDRLSREELEQLQREITTRLDTQSAESKRDRYRELFERSADAILIIDGDTFVDCNQATVDMLRYRNKAELLQTHPSELSPPKQPDGRLSYEKANEMMATAVEHGNHRFEWDHLRADGSIVPVEVLLTAVEKADRTLIHVVWRDISERKRLQADLLQAQKMDAMGKLTGGIAHDFNNLLVAILGYADLLEAELPENSAQHRFVELIQQSGQRAATLVGQLLAFSRKQLLQPRVIDLNGVVRDLEQMLIPLLGEDIRYTSEFDAMPLFIKADQGQIEQVVVNLATNARDAMSRSGLLAIETRRIEISEDSIGASVHLATGEYAVLSVADSGAGIAPDDLERIFDPFFTTKGMNEGTGLGLSTVHGIVKQSGGDIQVHTESEQGTVFKVYLPLTDERPSPRHPLAKAAQYRPAQRHATILLVEDEAVVSGLVEAVLTREGFKIVTAANGVEALELIEKLDLEPDLLLTDVIMPKMGGPELAKRLAETMPDLKILYSSGYTDSALTDRGALEEGVELIQKPYSPGDLVARIDRMLRED